MSQPMSLAHPQSEFITPTREGGAPVTYLCGHSLGLQPLGAADYVAKELERWGRLAVDGHFRGDDPWMTYHESLAGPSAALVGAAGPHEVSVQNTLSVNIHLMLASFYRPQGRRRKILCEAPAFPSDQYALETHLRHRGLDPDADLIEIPTDPDTMLLDGEQILETIARHGDDLSLVFLGGVQYISGQVLDMAAISKAAHEAEALCGFDLAHAAGNIPMHLHDWGVDFAVWCNYKYLNGGPGTLGTIYIHERHLAPEAGTPRLAGWWGYDKASRFAMRKGFVPAAGADGWALSNPPILAMAPLKASLPMFEQVGMAALYERGQTLVGELREGLGQVEGVRLITPAGSGNMTTLAHPDARGLFEHLQRHGVIGDWREPGIIRLAMCPLYNTPKDVARTLEVIGQFEPSLAR